MAGKKGTSAPPRKRPIERYEHTDKKRINNPQVGLVTPETDPVVPSHKPYDYVMPVPSVKPKQALDYDPHLDPQLVWAGKKEHSSFDVPTVSLHVHERIDPYTIIKAVRKKNGTGVPAQPSLFERPEEHRPLREEIDFYKHAHGWSNRLIAGDSLLVMNSLLEKEGMAGQVQMVYIDPPYGKTYNSNFQPFVNKRDVKDGRDEDLTQEPEMVRAFRDTWELGIHSYLTYLRDRLLLAHDLLNNSGSCFLQISEENLHHVRELLDEIFGAANFVSLIHYTTAGGFTSTTLSRAGDFLLWYAKDLKQLKYHQLFQTKKSPIGDKDSKYDQLELQDGTRRPLTFAEKVGEEELPKDARVFRYDTLVSAGFREKTTVDYIYQGQRCHPGPANNWKASVPEGMDRLAYAGRIAVTSKGKLVYVRYFDDFPAVGLTSMWADIGGTVQSRSDPKIYVVQTGTSVVERCMLMTSDPGDLVFDPTCGSGTTAYVAEQWGRRWITCDTSRVALTLAKQRLISSAFEYHELAHPEEGVGSGFSYRTVPHIQLRSIAHNPEIKKGMPQQQIEILIGKYSDRETLYDQPLVDRSKARVSGPFTMEAVPAPTVRSLEDIELGATNVKEQESLGDFRHAATPLLDASVARKGATLRHSEWRDELLKTGLRGKGGNQINFSRVEPLAGTRWLHADAETKGVKPERAVISFGPEYSLLEQRQVEMAWEEARTLVPKPAMIVLRRLSSTPRRPKILTS